MPSPSSPGTPPVRSPESCPPTNQHTAGGTNDSNISYALSPGSHSSLQQQFDQVTMVRLQGLITPHPLTHHHTLFLLCFTCENIHPLSAVASYVSTCGLFHDLSTMHCYLKALYNITCHIMYIFSQYLLVV